MKKWLIMLFLVPVFLIGCAKQESKQEAGQEKEISEVAEPQSEQPDTNNWEEVYDSIYDNLE